MSVQTLTLAYCRGHLFVRVGERDFMLDTGAPTSFGIGSSIRLCEESFAIPGNFLGVDADVLSTLLGVPTDGIIGADILGRFDCLMDSESEKVTFARDELSCEGTCIELDDVLGVPVIQVVLDDQPRRMFFDTGAQLSYFQGASLRSFPSAGSFSDFFTGYGQFDTDTYLVEISVGTLRQVMRFGQLPGILGMTLTLAGVEGIIGNEIMKDRRVGYFPRRRQLVLERP